MLCSVLWLLVAVVNPTYCITVGRRNIVSVMTRDEIGHRFYYSFLSVNSLFTLQGILASAFVFQLIVPVLDFIGLSIRWSLTISLCPDICFLGFIAGTSNWIFVIIYVPHDTIITVLSFRVLTVYWKGVLIDIEGCTYSVEVTKNQSVFCVKYHWGFLSSSDYKVKKTFCNLALKCTLYIWSVYLIF